MKRVLVIVSSKFGYDGITSVVRNYYMYQNHDEIAMDILTLNPVDDNLLQAMEQHGDHNYVIPYRNENPVKYFFDLRKLIKRGDYQIVHVHGGSCILAVELLAARMAGVKIRVAHSHNTASDFGMINTILKPVFKKCCTDGFACGKEAGEWMFEDKKFEIIYNGIDLDKFAFDPAVRDEFRRKQGLEDQFVVGHIGRFNIQKNHKKLISIYEEFSKIRKDAILVLIGDGELREEIEGLVKEKSLNVRFVGLSDEIPQWLQAMDIMLLPSLFEGLPVTAVEAQASGLPCVLSDTISPMTKLTDLVHFVELEASDAYWAQEILKVPLPDRLEMIDEIQEAMREKHFDIRENCKEILAKYGEMICQRSA